MIGWVSGCGLCSGPSHEYLESIHVYKYTFIVTQSKNLIDLMTL